MTDDPTNEADRNSSEEPSPNLSGEPSSKTGRVQDTCGRLSTERYQTFIENIEEGIYEVDIHGNFLYFNRSLCRIFGYPRDEIQFQNFAKFMEEDYAQKALAVFGEIYETGKGISDLTWQITTKEGEKKFIELSANLITNAKGEKLGFRGIARDITEKYRTQRAIRKSERRYRTLLDFVPYPIVVFTPDGKVSYLNPAFTETFGWTLSELEGKGIPYVPPGLEEETAQTIQRLLREKAILHHVTKRLTKDGRILDVVMRGALYSEEDGTSGELVILRDITREKKMANINDALLRISMALPRYPSLEALLDFISGEVKVLLDVEGALVILLDEEKNEFYFKSAAHDDSAAKEKMKEIRFPADKGVAGRTMRLGEPVIVPDTASDPDFYSAVDTQAGFRTKNMVDVPLKGSDRTIGVLCAMNKKSGPFDQTDVELLNMIAATVALSIENASYSDQLREAYQEVTSLNRAKDKVINHLSHELKTPLSVLNASLGMLEQRLSTLADQTWKPTFDRALRNLRRILEISYVVEDIIRERHYREHGVLSTLLEQCTDELESIVAQEAGEGPLVERIRKRIDETYGVKEGLFVKVFLDRFVSDTLQSLRPLFSHRQVEIVSEFQRVPAILIPIEPLRKVVEGLVKNAIENTPDEAKIEIWVRPRGKGAELVVRDYGVGITRESQKRIFEGFFPTQETMDYSSKRPFDFNAGGKGADLLRMKIFAERYGFQIEMNSSRCPHIPSDKDVCPGRLSRCEICKAQKGCHRSVATTFRVFFSAMTEEHGSTPAE